MSKQDDKFDQPIAGHDYDGIQEFDNPLPMWWLWTFLGTIIFAFIYYIHYELKIGPTLDEELKADMAVIEQLKAKAPKTAFTDDKVRAAFSDNFQINLGAQVYTGKCAACHGDKGQGLVGPNLTDKFWIHGSSPASIANTIYDGVLTKGMPAWKGQIKDEEVIAVVAFINSIKGITPAGAKAAEGIEDKNY